MILFFQLFQMVLPFESFSPANFVFFPPRHVQYLHRLFYTFFTSPFDFFFYHSLVLLSCLPRGIFSPPI